MFAVILFCFVGLGIWLLFAPDSDIGPITWPEEETDEGAIEDYLSSW